MFARREAKTRIQQRDWLAKKFAASSTNHVAGFLFSLRVARTNSPSGKRALLVLEKFFGCMWLLTSGRFYHLIHTHVACRAVARTLIGGGGGCIFIYSGSVRLISFEINFISKETSRAEPEYEYTPPPISVLATALVAWAVSIIPIEF